MTANPLRSTSEASYRSILLKRLWRKIYLPLPICFSQGPQRTKTEKDVRQVVVPPMIAGEMWRVFDGNLMREGSCRF